MKLIYPASERKIIWGLYPQKYLDTNILQDKTS